jgi:predicted O-linked N-acetylglucosamine transferase (SPINDLY family)
MSFPGTLGYDAVDGIIADDIVVPVGSEAAYHERVWRMPRCYFVQRWAPHTARARRAQRRRLAGGCTCPRMPHQSYKLSFAVFAIWMGVLSRVPAAVLWLLAPGRVPRRTCSASPRTPVSIRRDLSSHRTRRRTRTSHGCGCADLSLDTLPYGSHTTGCDALWAGVPLLTCPGDTFASRVGASLLHTAGLPELIASSLDDYGARLHALATNPGSLRAHRDHLERTRSGNPLFDTRGFARDWEALLERAYAERSLRADCAAGEALSPYEPLRSISSIL